MKMSYSAITLSVWESLKWRWKKQRLDNHLQILRKHFVIIKKLTNFILTKERWQSKHQTSNRSSWWIRILCVYRSMRACCLRIERDVMKERNEIQSVLNWTHLVFYKYFHRCPFLDGYYSLCYKPRPIHVRFIHTIYHDGGNGSASKLSSNHQNKKKIKKEKKHIKLKKRPILI